MNKQMQETLAEARRVFRIEAEALESVARAQGESFVEAVETIVATRGRLVVVGLGKSGHIARKIAATFASTGTPAFFVHAAEAQHGDLGMITGEDVVLAISFSGETEELVGLLPEVKRRGAVLIAMTGRPRSTLAKHAEIVLPAPVAREACPMNLAPTASTTAMLALGDALAIAVLKRRGFREEDFARVHPAGSLGKKLKKVSELMRTGADVPRASAGAPLKDAIVEMSRGRMGIVGLFEGDELVGCISDGDLRRILERGAVDLEAPARHYMTPAPKRIRADRLAAEAVRVMEDHKITVLFVEDERGRIVGAVHLHDLVEAGVA